MRKSEEILKWLQYIHSTSVLFNQSGEHMYLDKDSLNFPVGHYELDRIYFRYVEWHDSSECVDSEDMDNAVIEDNTIKFFNGESITTISVFTKLPLLVPKNVCNPQT